MSAEHRRAGTAAAGGAVSKGGWAKVGGALGREVTLARGPESRDGRHGRFASNAGPITEAGKLFQA